MSTERPPLSDRELWQSLAVERSVAHPAVSEMELAGWLEGRVDDVAAAKIEAAIANDPELRRAALELADLLGSGLPSAPSGMVVRAQALAGSQSSQPIRKSWWAAMFPALGQGLALQRGAFAGLAIVVAAFGFVLGGGLGEAYAEGKHASSKPPGIAKPFGRDTINDLNDLFADNT